LLASFLLIHQHNFAAVFRRAMQTGEALHIGDDDDDDDEDDDEE
jgi:hypothetical protein